MEERQEQDFSKILSRLNDLTKWVFQLEKKITVLENTGKRVSTAYPPFFVDSKKDVLRVENKSGFVPCEYKVLVKPDKVEEVRGRIVIPEHIRDKELREREDVTLIAVGGTAFTEPTWGDPTPKPGDRVKIAKYAGYFFKGADGDWYQVCNDKDIAGILVAEPAEKELHDSDQPDYAGDGIYANLRSQ